MSTSAPLATDGARSIPRPLTDAVELDNDHPKHDPLAPDGGRRGRGEVLVRAFGYTVAARYPDNSAEMVRERYSQIGAGELGNSVTEALDEVDSIPQLPNRIFDGLRNVPAAAIQCPSTVGAPARL